MEVVSASIKIVYMWKASFTWEETYKFWEWTLGVRNGNE